MPEPIYPAGADCPHVVGAPLDHQTNALRVEILTATEYCAVQEKPGAARLLPVRWVLSGGHPAAVYEPCPYRGVAGRRPLHREQQMLLPLGGAA